ncbi:MAG: glycosyl transferase family A, partial [Mesorhizobium sp.]
MRAMDIERVQGEGRTKPVQEANSMSMTKSEVCVIIAAKNAART